MREQERAIAEEPAETEAETETRNKGSEDATLFGADGAERFRSRWLEVQSRFVDDPKRSVEEANALVSEVIQKLTAVFADQQKTLEGQLGDSGKLSTEDLRVALRRYRAFFDRLLSV